MLDFGTDMDSRKDSEENGDLFSLQVDQEEQKEPVPEESLPVQEEKPKAKRPNIKPPALPKYNEPPTPPPPVKPAANLYKKRRRGISPTALALIS